MRKRKWLARVLLAVAATMSLSVPVFADEPVAMSAVDSTIPTRYVGYTSGFETDTRLKEDYSYHYINSTSGIYLGVISRASDGTNCTQNGRAIVPLGEYFIANYVKENGKNYCKLYITAANAGTSGSARGKWSPDSVGNYPVVN